MLIDDMQFRNGVRFPLTFSIVLRTPDCQSWPIFSSLFTAWVPRGGRFLPYIYRSACGSDRYENSDSFLNRKKRCQRFKRYARLFGVQNSSSIAASFDTTRPYQPTATSEKKEVPNLTPTVGVCASDVALSFGYNIWIRQIQPTLPSHSSHKKYQWNRSNRIVADTDA